MDLQQKKKNRFLFLKHIYECGQGSTDAVFDMQEAGAELSFDYDQISQIVEYLINEDLLEPYGLGGTIKLSHWGLKEVEQAMEHPEAPTEHFLPVNIINIGTMTNSTIQQASNQSTIVSDNTKLEGLSRLLSELKEIAASLSLSATDKEELDSEIKTIEVQQASPKPKNIIIRESLKTIRSLLESVAGNAITPGIMGGITHLLNLL